jgi:glycosyltransferase involved in cell wall biosynthesis
MVSSAGCVGSKLQSMARLRLPRERLIDVKNNRKKISLVVPFYNEGLGVAEFFERINNVFSSVADRYEVEVICVNDGSGDTTFVELKREREKNPFIRIVDLSRNFGKEVAITAGLDFAKGDAVIPIDADLQQPPEIILEMLQEWENGSEVVLAKRTDRATDGVLQKMAARSFYKVAHKLSSVDIPADVGDFRLMDRKVVDAVKLLRENCRFMKGIFSWVGFRSAIVEYKVDARKYGKTRFGTWRLWNFALEGLASFSTVPLQISGYVGVAISLFAFIYGFYLVVRTFVFGIDVPGYASLMVMLLFSTGVQLIGIGVLGYYIGRIFLEVKRRPIYLVREIIE